MKESASSENVDDVAAARAAYDAAAREYARLVGTELTAATEGPIERALLSAFVELVGDVATKPVADVGCGPGRVAAYLRAHGLEVVGFDVSTEMLAVARDTHPHIQFEEGRLTALPAPDHAFAAAVCWYSIIHTPPEHLGGACAELARAVAPNGPLLVAFQAGHGEPVHRSGTYGTEVAMTSYRHSPDHVDRCLTDVGFQVHARTVRQPAFAHESTPQAFILARAGGAGAPFFVGSSVSHPEDPTKNND